jgi:hypothetical protein
MVHCRNFPPVKKSDRRLKPDALIPSSRVRWRIVEETRPVRSAVDLPVSCDFHTRLCPPYRNEHHRFVICVRDAEKPVNTFLLQPLAYRLLQDAPVGAMKYLHFHQ